MLPRSNDGAGVRHATHLPRLDDATRLAPRVPCAPKLWHNLVIMDTINSITAAEFIAFLKCPTKAHLLAIGDPAPATYFTDMEARISLMYKSAAMRSLRVGAEMAEPLDFGELLSSRDHEVLAHPVDCKTAIYNSVLSSHEPGGCQSRKSTPSSSFVPVLLSPWDKPDVSDSLLVCFGALALSQITGILEDIGTVIYGEGHRRKTVKVGDHIVQTRQAIDAIVATNNTREPPPLLLNRHCAVCDFQQRCRGLAIERDNLSLLSAMTGKERAKFHSKGIFSITQLSYGYRPRRRKRNRPDAESSKNTDRYNMDDCRAAAKVADALVRICGTGSPGLDAVDVSLLEVGFQRTFGKFDGATPEFAKINDAAYWDYQRSKVYARTDKAIRRTVRKSERRRKNATVEKEVTVREAPETCPRCHATKFWACSGRSHVVYDLKFTRRGIRRWAVRYDYNMYRCSECRVEMTIYPRGSQYGPILRAFIVYLLIELRLSNQKAIEHASSLFDLPLRKNTATQIKVDMAEKYTPTYRGILRQIAKGALVHADETKGVVKGGGHYVWVFANLTTVAYVYAKSREAAILGELLDGFNGVLVSDFYAAYDFGAVRTAEMPDPPDARHQ